MKKKLALIIALCAIGGFVLYPVTSYAAGSIVKGYVTGSGASAVGNSEDYTTRSLGQLVVANGTVTDPATLPADYYDNPANFSIAIYASDIDYLANEVNAIIDQRIAINARIEAERAAIRSTFGD